MSPKEKLYDLREPAELIPSFNPGDRANLLEILQRCRRIETRLTRLLEVEGISTGIQRPWWVGDQSVVMLPSPMTTIDAVIKTIPEGWTKPVQVVLKENQQFEVLCHIKL